MSSLAEQALEHARQRMAGHPKKRPTSTAAKISTPTSEPRTTGVVVTGPVNHFMYLEGRAWAVDLVASLRASPDKDVIERLVGATAGRPAGYVAGIQSVIDIIKGASHANEG